MPTVDIQVPMVSKKTKPTGGSGLSQTVSSSSELSNKTTLTLFNQLTGGRQLTGGGEDEQRSSEEAAKTTRSFNFVVMTKKGNKTQYHNMEVPVTSEFAQQFRAREEVFRRNNFLFFFL